MLELKPLSEDSIPNALTRAKHYRLLNEPWQAESICRDILRIAPTHQTALLYLILALTDQFESEFRKSKPEAKQLCSELKSEYEQNYYRGIIEERLAKTALSRETPRAKFIAYEHYASAMRFFEEAENNRPEGNQDSVLRWNACARVIKGLKLHSSETDKGVQPFLDI